MISFIVPIFYQKKDNYIVKRTIELIQLFQEYKGVELIIADASKLHIFHTISSNIKVVKLNFTIKNFSPALARNKAVKYATKKYIFFLDIDLSFNEQFIQELIYEVQQTIEKQKCKFLMLPCLYLTKKGTKLFEDSENKTKVINKLRDSLMLGDNELVARIAVNTSAIVLEKDYFELIGRFSEDFMGHGGEDFELLHRLVSFSPHSRISKEYYIDKVEQFPADYQGFRRYMAYYSLPYLFSNLVLVHRWHERPLFNSFYMQRSKNEKLLFKKIMEHDKKYTGITWKSKKEPLDYHMFLNNLWAWCGLRNFIRLN
jgi:predicted glycosyltransferase involved in capsule biosynthesis